MSLMSDGSWRKLLDAVFEIHCVKVMVHCQMIVFEV